MNKDIIAGKWKQFKGSAQSKWGEITDDELDEVEGDATRLAGLIQERYGRTKEQAEREIEEWQESLTT